MSNLLTYPDIAQVITNNIINNKKKKWACHSNRASAIGHQCIRKLVYDRLNWEDATDFSDETILKFEEGNNQERIVIKELRDAGIEITNCQDDFTIRTVKLYPNTINEVILETNITGHIDGMIKVINPNNNDERIPIEIKSVSPYIYPRLNVVEDLTLYPWTNCYYSQVQLYMYSKHCVKAYLFLKNKNSGERKLLKDSDGDTVIKFSNSMLYSIFVKADIIEKHCKNKTYPERIKYSLKVCGTGNEKDLNCSYRHLCINDLTSVKMDSLDNPENDSIIEDYLAILDKRTESKAVEKEYESLKSNMAAIIPFQDGLYKTKSYIIEAKIKGVGTKRAGYLTYDIAKRVDLEV